MECGPLQGSKQEVSPPAQHVGSVELPFVACEPMNLALFESTNVGFLLGEKLAKVQTCRLGSEATWPRRRR